jgi:hypothetical protein
VEPRGASASDVIILNKIARDASVESHVLKLGRAQEHLDQLDTQIRAWIDSEPYGIVDEPDPDPIPQKLLIQQGYYGRFRITRVDPISDAIGLLIGDCLFNLRSSLDNLAYRLAEVAVRRRHGRNLTSREAEGSEFPIFFNHPMSAEDETRKIGCLDAAARAAIKALQPHHRGNFYRDDPLWRIHEMNRIDKHRRLTLCALLPHDPSGQPKVQITKHEDWNFEKIPFFRAEVFGEVKRDAVVAKYTVIRIDPNRPVNMHPGLPLQVAFGQGEPLEFQAVVPTLNLLCEFVRQSVIAKLAQFL